MTESSDAAPEQPAAEQSAPLPQPPPPPPSPADLPAPPALGAPGPEATIAGYPTGPAPLGKVRSTGTCIVLTIVTLGIYTLVWFYMVHDEMKRHTREGLGGGLALVLAFFVGFVMPYISSHEIGTLYSRRGQQPPVSAATGLWYFPGMLILIGPIVWFVKTNGALNKYWQSLGAP